MNRVKIMKLSAVEGAKERDVGRRWCYNVREDYSKSNRMERVCSKSSCREHKRFSSSPCKRVSPCLALATWCHCALVQMSKCRNIWGGVIFVCGSSRVLTVLILSPMKRLWQIEFELSCGSHWETPNETLSISASSHCIDPWVGNVPCCPQIP